MRWREAGPACRGRPPQAVFVRRPVEIGRQGWVAAVGEHAADRRRCQSNGASSTRSAICPLASDDLRCKGAPLGQCGRASLLVHLAGDEMALLIEDPMGSG